MTRYDTEAARRWIEHNRDELIVLEVDPRDAVRMKLAAEIRHEIARVDGLIVRFSSRQEEESHA